jgi:hypothetical protein
MASKSRRRNGEPHRVTTDRVGCPYCGWEVNMTHLSVEAGWRRLHTCRHGCIEGLVVEPNEAPFAWRLVDKAALTAPQAFPDWWRILHAGRNLPDTQLGIEPEHGRTQERSPRP